MLIFFTLNNSLAVAIFEAARHIAVDGALDHAVTLLTTGDGIVSERVLLADGTRIVGRASDVRGADALAGLLITSRCRRTLALLAVGEAEEAGLAPRALPTDHVGLALALPADLGAVVAERAIGVAVAGQRAAVEVGAQRDDGFAAERIASRVVDVKMLSAAFFDKLVGAIDFARL